MAMKRAMTFWYDENSGEFEKVDISPVFESENALFQADVLGDCLGVMTELYNESVGNFQADLTRLQHSAEGIHTAEDANAFLMEE